MKITLEASTQQGTFAMGTYPKVIVEHQADGMTLEEVWHILVRPALLAFGYQPGTLDKLEKKLDY